MEKGIDLNLTKSLFGLRSLLEVAIETAATEKRLVSRVDFSLFEKIFSLKQEEGYVVFDAAQSNYKIGRDVHVYNGDKSDKKSKSDVPPPITFESLRSHYLKSYKFWVGVVWEENGKRDPCIRLEFDEEHCPKNYWDKVKELAGTSGKYYSRVHSMIKNQSGKALASFFLKDEYLGQFYDENTDLSCQKEILAGFINEVLNKL